MEELSRSKALAAKVLRAAFRVLKESGGELPTRKVFEGIEEKAELDEWATFRYEKSGGVRWRSVLSFYSIGCVKAGFLAKKKGVWYLTPEGESAVDLGEAGLLKAVDDAYAKWKEGKGAGEPENVEDGQTDDASPEAERNLAIDEIEQTAMEGLKRHVGLKGPYEFQDMVAALLRAMGYHTPFVAPGGKDGGIDVLAYRDPLGTIPPRIKVQVKHRGQPASVHEIRQLMGLLQKDGDAGIFVSTGGFTPDAKATARASNVHVELIDLDRFIELWQKFHANLSDEDKSKLPLVPIYFLAPTV